VDHAGVVDAFWPGGEVDLPAVGVDGRDGDDGGADRFKERFLLWPVWGADIGASFIGFVEEDCAVLEFAG
jgi:hypothetical protein